VAGRLGHHTPDGACDDTCGCANDVDPGVAAASVGVTLIPMSRTGPTEDVPIACTLDAAAIPERMAAWQAMLAQATAREAIAGGVRVRFADDVDVPALAGLAAAEQRCCAFFTFRLTLDGEIALEVTAPDDARPVLDALVGNDAG
jgi:hypothetical protein